MKFILIILLLPTILMGQNPDTVDHPYLAEYCNLVYRASTHKAYHILNVVPQSCTGQPSYVAEIFGGPHDDGYIGPIAPGNLYVGGSVFGVSCGGPINITVDSAGTALPAVTQLYCTASNTSPYWTDVIVTTDSTTGRQVGIAGELAGGLHGNGTDNAVNQTSFVWATFPNGTHIIKVTGQYVLLALDSKGHVWSWAAANNKAQLGRGSSPTVPYTLPDTIRLPSGRYAVDIADAGPFGVIVLDDGETLGIGDHPKYFAGPSASTSNTPQNITSFISASVGTFLAKKAFADAGAVFLIGNKSGVDSCLISSGDNICGEIGNGQMYPMNGYSVSPPPAGSTPQPYAYDNGLGEYLTSSWVSVCPGTHNWVCGYMGPSNCWNAVFVNNKGESWAWGRGKSGQIMDNRASCDYPAGGLNGTYPDMVNIPYPIQIFPFAITSGSLITPTCFYCIANPGATNCSQGTGCYNGTLAAPAVHSSNQVLSGVTSATITPSISYASGSKEYLNVVTFVSGPVTPVMPFNTGANIPISGLSVPGPYIFKDSTTDIMWKTNVAYDTITVNPSNTFLRHRGSRLYHN
jgi:hypothetical protein